MSFDTSRSVPQHTAQIVAAFAGRNRSAFRLSQMGQHEFSPTEAIASQNITP
jgi:hypothetical protein